MSPPNQHDVVMYTDYIKKVFIHSGKFGFSSAITCGYP